MQSTLVRKHKLQVHMQLIREEAKVNHMYLWWGSVLSCAALLSAVQQLIQNKRVRSHV